MIVGDVGCLHAYIRRLLHIGAERSAIKPVANKNKKAKTFRFSLFVPPQVGRSPRSDSTVCGISHIHYRRSSSVLSTMLTLNNLRVLRTKINPSTSLFFCYKGTIIILFLSTSLQYIFDLQHM